MLVVIVTVLFIGHDLTRPGPPFRTPSFYCLAYEQRTCVGSEVKALEMLR